MSWQRLASAFAIIVVVAAIVAGLVISGSPERQRLLRLDEQRVSDLRTLSQRLSSRYASTRELPAELAGLVDGRTLSSLPRDPESDEPYVYELPERRVFRLCAEFALASEDREPDDFWSHGAGRQCFSFDLSDVRFN
jgi:hypothetical protein